MELLLGLHTVQPRNILTLLINVALVRTPVRIKQGLAAACIEINQEMSTIVAECQRNVICFEEFQILVLLGHGFGRMVMAAHVSCQGDVISESKSKLPDATTTKRLGFLWGDANTTLKQNMKMAFFIFLFLYEKKGK